MGGGRRVGSGYPLVPMLRLPLATPAPHLHFPDQCVSTGVILPETTSGSAWRHLWLSQLEMLLAAHGAGSGMPRHSPVHRTAAKGKNTQPEVPIVPRLRNTAQGGAAPAAPGEGLELPPHTRPSRPGQTSALVRIEINYQGGNGSCTWVSPSVPTCGDPFSVLTLPFCPVCS